MLPAAATPLGARTALAGHTPTPASVNLAGSLQSEASGGACGDWDAGCAGSAFTGQGNGVYLFESEVIPAGDWEYKVALGSWDENYGANFQHDGPNIALQPRLRRRRCASTTTTRRTTSPTASATRSTRSPGSFNERARLRRRLAARVPAHAHVGRRRRRRVHVRDDGPPVGQLRAQGRDERELEQPELRRGRRAGQHRVHRGPAAAAPSRSRSTARPTSRRSPSSGAAPSHDNNVRVGRPPPRLAATRSTGRRAARWRPTPRSAIRFRTFHDDVTGGRGSACLQRRPAAPSGSSR